MAVKFYLIQKRLLIPTKSFFVNIGNTLKINKDKLFLAETNNALHHVLKAIKKYSVHPSILSIKEKMNNIMCSFPNVTYEESLNYINSLDALKSTQSENISIEIIKDHAYFLPILSYKTLTNP